MPQGCWSSGAIGIFGYPKEWGSYPGHLGDGLFRIGEDHGSPQTLRFDAVAGGLALSADHSGCTC